MSCERVLLTKTAKDCMREDNKMGVIIRLPKASVTVGDKDYPQILDALDMVVKSLVADNYSY